MHMYLEPNTSASNFTPTFEKYYANIEFLSQKINDKKRLCINYPVDEANSNVFFASLDMTIANKTPIKERKRETISLFVFATWFWAHLSIHVMF